MKRRLLILLMLVLALPLLFSCDQGTETGDGDYAVRVLISYPNNSVESPANYVYIQPGEDVYFPVTIRDGYEYVGNDMGAEYVDGTLIIKDIRYPTTVTLDVKAESSDSFYMAGEGGTIKVNTEDGLPIFGEPVTLTAVPDRGNTFIGWTVGAILTEQGTLVSEDADYTCTLSRETPVYANFKTPGEAIVCYHLNGGKVEGSSSDVYYASFPIGYYHYPNAIGDVGIFERSGYTLLEYSENKNGTGFITCPGGKIFMETDEIIHMWLQWEKWSVSSLFQVSESNGGYYIDKYTGTETVIVIPGTIRGKDVIGIREGAFDGRPMETLILHKNIQVIEDGAFKNCKKINTVYMQDTVKTLSNSIFKSCNAFQNFRFNAARAPSLCSQSWGAYTTKFERAVYLAGEEHNLLAVLSGSSSLYATDSPLLEDLMADAGYDFDVLNFGIQASVPQLFFMEFLLAFTDEGDVIIQAPETSGTLRNSISEVHIQILQSTYNAFRYVDISNYENLFGAIQTCHNMRAKSSDTTYEAQRSDDVTINLWGDRENPHKTGVVYTPSGSIRVHGGSIPSKSIQQYNDIYRLFEKQGVRVYYSIAPMAAGAFSSSSADIAAYENTIDTKLLAPRISAVRDYVIPQEYMHNSNWHTNVEGMILRTNRLANDLITQFKKEENR